MSGKIPYHGGRGAPIPYHPNQARKKRLTEGDTGPILVGHPKRANNQPHMNYPPPSNYHSNYIPQSVPKHLINVDPQYLNRAAKPDVKFMKTSKYSTAIPSTGRGVQGQFGVTNLINQINAERNLKAREKNEKEMTHHNLIHANEIIEQLTSQVKSLEADNLELTNELTRYAQTTGGVYDQGANHILSPNEFGLMNVNFF